MHNLSLRFCSEAGLLNKSSSLGAALGLTKFITIIAIFLAHFVVLLKSVLDVQQTHLWGYLLDKSSSLAAALGKIKFTFARIMILVTLCCAI